MRQQSKSISIARPIATVFSFLADAGNDTLWRKEVVGVTKTEDLGTVSTYVQTLETPRGRRSEAVVEVTEVRPDWQVAFTTTTGSIRRFGCYELRAIDNGTEVTLRLSADLVGVQKALTPLLALATASRLEQLTGLKQVLEGRAASQ